MFVLLLLFLFLPFCLQLLFSLLLLSLLLLFFYCYSFFATTVLVLLAGWLALLWLLPKYATKFKCKLKLINHSVNLINVILCLCVRVSVTVCVWVLVDMCACGFICVHRFTFEYTCSYHKTPKDTFVTKCSPFSRAIRRSGVLGYVCMLLRWRKSPGCCLSEYLFCCRWRCFIFLLLYSDFLHSKRGNVLRGFTTVLGNQKEICRRNSWSKKKSGVRCGQIDFEGFLNKESLISWTYRVRWNCN